MGTITARYSIDNLWGLREPEPYRHAGSFDARFRVAPLNQDPVTDVAEMFWPFHNFEVAPLNWETYARRSSSTSSGMPARTAEAAAHRSIVLALTGWRGRDRADARTFVVRGLD
jgi:hypothetical protein